MRLWFDYNDKACQTEMERGRREKERNPILEKLLWLRVEFVAFSQQ